MESFRNFFDEEWDNLSTMLSYDQDSSEYDHGLNIQTSSNFCPSINGNSCAIDDQSFLHVSPNINPNFYQYFSQESSNSSNGAASFPYMCHDDYEFFKSNVNLSPTINNICDQSVDFCMTDDNINNSVLGQVFSDDAMEEILCLKQDVATEKLQMEDLVISGSEASLKRKLELPESIEDEANTEKIDKNPKRVSRVNKNKNNVHQPKKKQKVIAVNITNGNGDDGEEINKKKTINAQGTSCCSSEEDDSNGCQDLHAKTRASRGAATDPQSLYARKRRERINERLKVLQNLVPNGTKVDISTMLEEAVEYVKFLQLQIKLLSSDDMWMFAPIAYNGMDMGLYKKISPTI